ncbi:hypothetical protein AWB79_04078 [Caballeronia hypogeia]|uniref:Uncharacterized protein n=1 Tax=Caballeronia hypogeia TaxID=1777140 RepID=A0A158BQQ6_9BURK|nr:hypothetical protein [Caballeronia hypogeia]SAK72310.1 hypothetical protein AWB79_04078 [Caballeronia hypogeia]
MDDGNPIVLGGGIGQHSEAIRAQVTNGLTFLGAQHRLVATHEEPQIARHCGSLLAA